MERVIWMSDRATRWLAGKPVTASDFMKERMHVMLDKTILDYIADGTKRIYYEDDSYIRSMLLNHPIMDVLLHPYSGFVYVKMDDVYMVRRRMYTMYCERLSRTKKDEIVNKIVQSIRDMISHANSFISSVYCGKILDKLVAKRIAESFNDPITFSNVIHIKLIHDVREYSFRYVMYVKPDITNSTIDDKTKRFYNKIWDRV